MKNELEIQVAECVDCQSIVILLEDRDFPGSYTRISGHKCSGMIKFLAKVKIDLDCLWNELAEELKEKEK